MSQVKSKVRWMTDSYNRSATTLGLIFVGEIGSSEEVNLAFLHEAAHLLCGHNNSYGDDLAIGLDKSSLARQYFLREVDAWGLVLCWISPQHVAWAKRQALHALYSVSNFGEADELYKYFNLWQSRFSNGGRRDEPFGGRVEQVYSHLKEDVW